MWGNQKSDRVASKIKLVRKIRKNDMQQLFRKFGISIIPSL